MPKLKPSFDFAFLLLVSAISWPLLGGAAENQSVAAKSDPGWPRQVTRNDVRFVYYQPQVDEWKDYRSLRARLAFVLTPKSGKPAVGIEELRGRTTANLQSRTVLIDQIEITAVRFPSLPEAEAAKMESLLKANFPGKPITVSLDRLIASVEASQPQAKAAEVKTNPPAVFVSTEPAILLTVDGEPVKAPITGTDLQVVVNTNWNLFWDPAGKNYLLLVDKLWLSAAKLEGPWSIAQTLPAGFAKLPKDQGWENVKKAIPIQVTKGKAAPKVFYSSTPAELILFVGSPVYKSIEGTQLLYATNTDSWVFENSADKQIYFLVTGRWFRAPKLEGPWTYATDDLPDDFKRIPADSEVAAVLTSVPGTPQSKDAVLLADVPTSVVVKTSEVEAKVKVTYYGEPQFAPIEGTSLSYATNTSSDVLKIEDKYYLCDNAVWFVSDSPTGPWKVATAVPESVYSIPPSSPIYRVKYVKVYEDSGEVVSSYTAGYSGAYVAAAPAGYVLVWGTGYYYPPYIYPAPVPIYRPYYATYGVAAAYYPNTGYYGIGGYAYGPYGGVGRAAWYNPNTGAYGGAYTSQTAYGGHTSAWGYNPSTNTSWSTNQAHNYYAQWGSSTIQRGDQTIQTGHVVTNSGGTAYAKGDNNLYVGHDGNVYKRDSSGDWSKYNNGGWQPVNTSSSSNLSAKEGANNRQNPDNAPGNQLKTTRTPSDQNRQNKVSGDQPKTARTPSNQNKQGSYTQGQNTKGRNAENGRQRSNQGTGAQTSQDTLNGLNQDASGRKRGSEQLNLQQRSQNRSSTTSRSNGGRGTRGGGRRRD
jgi:hypothetical protein